MTSTAFRLHKGRVQLREMGLRIPYLPAVASFVGYLGVGAYLGLVLHAYYGDAYSRVANASYVLFSRDPHLAALGFVWMPLPSVVELAILPAKALFPAISEQGFAAVIMSAFFMALAVTTMNGILSDFGVRRRPRLVLVAAFALHPMVVYFAANGASEAPTIFFMLLACRYLARYVTTPSTMSLVGVGVALAGGYLTRYEVAAGAVGVAGLILLVAFRRAEGPASKRLVHAAADIGVALTPFVLVFVAWALASLIIVGSPFAQFTSEYGNSSQMQVSAVAGANEVGLPFGASVVVAGMRLTMLSIAAPVGIAAAAWLLWARRDSRVLAVAAALGPVILFMTVAYVFHLIAPWLRYFILVVPLGVLLLGLAISPAHEAGSLGNGEPRRLPRRGIAGLTAVVLAIAVAAVPVAAVGLLDPYLAKEESVDIAPLLGPGAAAPDRLGSQLQTFAVERSVAEYVDAMHLPRGSVLVDVFLGFPIVLQSGNPLQFVITPDRDFRPALADPLTFGVSYLLVPEGGVGALDAVNRTYGRLASAEDFAVPVHVFDAIGNRPNWVLYRLVGASS